MEERFESATIALKIALSSGDFIKNLQILACMVRAFISVDFMDETIKENIIKVQNELKESGAHIKYVDKDILHITLAFLGEISESKINEVKKIMDSITFHPLELEVKGLGLLPNENYVRVVYADISGKVEKLANIKNELCQKLQKKGFKGDNRPFTPHLTIGRVKSGKNKHELVRKVNELTNKQFGKQRVETIKLKQSILKKDGPEYITLYQLEEGE